jgi:hypothetical protein
MGWIGSALFDAQIVAEPVDPAIADFVAGRVAALHTLWVSIALRMPGTPQHTSIAGCGCIQRISHCMPCRDP